MARKISSESRTSSIIKTSLGPIEVIKTVGKEHWSIECLIPVVKVSFIRKNNYNSVWAMREILMQLGFKFEEEDTEFLMQMNQIPIPLGNQFILEKIDQSYRYYQQFTL